MSVQAVTKSMSIVNASAQPPHEPVLILYGKLSVNKKSFRIYEVLGRVCAELLHQGIIYVPEVFYQLQLQR